MSSASNTWVKRLHSTTVPAATSNDLIQGRDVTKRRRTNSTVEQHTQEGGSNNVQGSGNLQPCATWTPSQSHVQSLPMAAAPSHQYANPGNLRSQPPSTPLLKSIPMSTPTSTLWGEVKHDIRDHPTLPWQNQSQRHTKDASDVPMDFTDDDAGDAQYVDYYMAKYNL
eukprot:m.158844 g.158844  ORF g.158844 m.158844 type:complete len:168 (+) comp17986_c0_seq2:278-781(+)